MEGIRDETIIGRDCREHGDCGYPLKLLKCKKKGKNKEGKDIYVDIREGEEGKCIDVSGYVPPPEGLSLDFKARDTCFSRGLKCLGIGVSGELKPDKSKKKTRKTKRRTNKKLKKSKKNKRRKRMGKKSKRRNR